MIVIQLFVLLILSLFRFLKSQESWDIHVTDSEVDCIDPVCDGSLERPFKLITEAFNKVDKLVEERGVNVDLNFNILLDSSTLKSYTISDGHFKTPLREVFFGGSKSIKIRGLKFINI